jgi:hypothetical protein
MTSHTKQNESDHCLGDGTPKSSVSGPHYEIRLKGHLNSTWMDWLDGLEVELQQNGETVLSGIIVDQAALLGILNTLIRMNLTLLSVNEIINKD